MQDFTTTQIAIGTQGNFYLDKLLIEARKGIARARISGRMKGDSRDVVDSAWREYLEQNGGIIHEGDALWQALLEHLRSRINNYSKPSKKRPENATRSSEARGENEGPAWLSRLVEAKASQGDYALYINDLLELLENPQQKKIAQLRMHRCTIEEIGSELDLLPHIVRKELAKVNRIFRKNGLLG